jgi:hypothetical protein
MSNEEQYKFVRGVGSDEELEKYRECFSKNGTEKSVELLKWFHKKNLPGAQSIYYAIDKSTNQIAAIYTYLPVLLKCMDKVVVAMQSFDTLTDQKHRSKRLFIKLASKLEEEERKNNTALIYGFPNENSVHGFVNKLGFIYFGEVPFLVKPLRFSYIFRKIFKKTTSHIVEEINCVVDAPKEVLLEYNSSIKWISSFDEEYENLWQEVSEKINIGVNRNAAYMNWRYFDKPDENYQRFGFYKNGKLEGVIIFTLKNKHDGKIGYLMEMLFTPGNEIAGKKLLQFCSDVLKKNKADVILAWCFRHSFNYFCHRQTGFYKFPEKLRPQKLGMIAKTLNSRRADDIYNVKNWYFSYSDSDTV